MGSTRTFLWYGYSSIYLNSQPMSIICFLTGTSRSWRVYSDGYYFQTFILDTKRAMSCCVRNRKDLYSVIAAIHSTDDTLRNSLIICMNQRFCETSLTWDEPFRMQMKGSIFTMSHKTKPRQVSPASLFRWIGIRSLMQKQTSSVWSTEQPFIFHFSVKQMGFTLSGRT